MNVLQQFCSYALLIESLQVLSKGASYTFIGTDEPFMGPKIANIKSEEFVKFDQRKYSSS